ncbi:unnamed protein product [Closterium sp. NIES-64]|nr:unnamed protein product [Closterium sp. NIES-65]CAI5988572.1 unnamed protein product [Closterium sp. NIES-64]
MASAVIPCSASTMTFLASPRPPIRFSPSPSPQLTRIAVRCASQREDEPMRRRHVSRREMLFVSALPVALAAAGPIGAAVAADGDKPATVATAPPPGDIPFVQELLERSRANKAKYDEERLNDYYRRNFKDYFDFVGGTLQVKREDKLTDNEKEILKWIEANK